MTLGWPPAAQRQSPGVYVAVPVPPGPAACILPALGTEEAAVGGSGGVQPWQPWPVGGMCVRVEGHLR